MMTHKYQSHGFLKIFNPYAVRMNSWIRFSSTFFLKKNFYCQQVPKCNFQTGDLKNNVGENVTSSALRGSKHGLHKTSENRKESRFLRESPEFSR